MTIVLDQVRRALAPNQDGTSSCIVCRRPILTGQRSMTVRGSVQVHQGCATYRMRQVDSGARRLGYPPH